MTRLQQSIEDLKVEFGDEADDQKVIKASFHSVYTHVALNTFVTVRKKVNSCFIILSRRKKSLYVCTVLLIDRQTKKTMITA